MTATNPTDAMLEAYCREHKMHHNDVDVYFVERWGSWKKSWELATQAAQRMQLTKNELALLIDYNNTMSCEADSMDYGECATHHDERIAYYETMRDELTKGQQP